MDLGTDDIVEHGGKEDQPQIFDAPRRIEDPRGDQKHRFAGLPVTVEKPGQSEHDRQEDCVLCGVKQH